MVSSAAKGTCIAVAIAIVAHLIGRRVAGSVMRLRQSLMGIDANLAEARRLREAPRPLDEGAVVERTQAEIADWDLAALAKSLQLEESH